MVLDSSIICVDVTACKNGLLVKKGRLVIPNGNTIPLDIHCVCSDSNSISVDITVCPNGLLVKKGKDWQSLMATHSTGHSLCVQ